jgi:uncharacterized membrane protein
MKIRLAVLFLTMIVAATACSYDKEVLSPCGTTVKTFSNDVSPLIQTRCATPQCHASNSTNIGGPFTNYSQIKAKATQIMQAVESGRMPQGSKLTQEQINTISCWVESGALNN